MAPYVVFHIAEYLCAMIALFAYKDLVVAASMRVDEVALYVLIFKRCILVLL